MYYTNLQGFTEELLFTEAFEAAHPDPNDQVSMEEKIASKVFDEFSEFDKHTAARWIIEQVTDDMICLNPHSDDWNYQDEPVIPVSLFLELIVMLERYLTGWQNGLSDIEEPHEEEASQAGRDTLILALKYLQPDWVEAQIITAMSA